MNTITKQLIAHCPVCRKKHLTEDTIEHNGVLLCRLTGSQVERITPPIPLHVYTFDRFRITIRRRVVLGNVALRAGLTFILTRPRIEESCLLLSTKQYGLLSIPMSAVEMTPCIEASR